MSITISQQLLVSTVTNPVIWTLTSTAVLVSLLFPCLLLSWKLKNQIIFEEPTWDFRIREVPFHEYEGMMKDYMREYSFLLSHVIRIDLAILLFLGTFGTSTPYILRISIPALLLSPYAYGALVILFGIVLVHLLFHAIETDATDHFPFSPPSRFRKAIKELSSFPGISWIGIRMAIGEAAGYYTIRDPVVVGRIEAIESNARLDGIVDKYGTLREITGYLSLQSDEETITKTIRTDTEFSRPKVLELIRWMVREYISAKGDDGLLADVVDDLGLEMQ